MAENMHFTPVHRETGMALPVIVHPEDFVLTPQRQHHTEHPSIREELADNAGQILRHSRTYQLPDHLHYFTYTTSYHNIFWGPETLPTTTKGKLDKTLLHIARVIPRYGIEMQPDGFNVRRLSDDEHAFLLHPEVTHIEGRNPRQRARKKLKIGLAITNYALAQDVGELFSARTIENFQTTLDIRRERELGNQIIRAAIDETIRPIQELYDDCVREGMVDPRAFSLRAVVRNYTPNDLFANFYELLHSQLPGYGVDEMTVPSQTELPKLELAEAA